MGDAEFSETRELVVGSAKGVVLEIGFGPGYNLPFYSGVERLYALEPSRELYEYATERIKGVSFPIESLFCGAEQIPLPDSSVDSVVSTWTLCSVSDVQKVLSEIRRVLKPSGTFLFVEHGLSPKQPNATIQKVATPVTKYFTGNCRMDRNIELLITNAGFRIDEITKAPEDGRPLMFSYRGIARK